MKGNTTHNNIRLWNVANLALFICAIFCLRYYIINTTDSLIICLIMNMTIVISMNEWRKSSRYKCERLCP